MAEISVRSSELRTKAQTLSQLNQSFNTQITVLQQNEQSVCSMWEGEAKDAFHNAFTHDKGMMDQFKQAIAKYVQALLDIAQHYETAEQKNTQTATTRTYR